MRYFIYPGPEDVKELWGCIFPKNEPVGVIDDALASKCTTMGFKEVEHAPLEVADEPTSDPTSSTSSINNKAKREDISKARRTRGKTAKPYDDMPGETRIDVGMAMQSTRVDLIDFAKRRGIRGATNKKKNEIIRMLVEKYGELD